MFLKKLNVVKMFSIMFLFLLTLSLLGCGEKENVTATSIKISSSTESYEVAQNATLQLNASVLPTNATSKEVSWSSSNENIATVGETGLVSGLEIGEATITVTLMNSDLTDSVTISVVEDQSIKETFSTFSITTDVESGYSFDESTNVYTINVAGEYTVSGLLEGQLLFASTLVEKCTLYLDNAYIENSNGSAVYWTSENSKIEIKAKENTTNYLIEKKYEATESSGALNSENNIEIGGSGIIYIASEFKHAVKGSEIIIKGTVELHLSAASDGIHGKAIEVTAGTVNITNCSDGLEAEVNSKGNKGTISITGGTLNISNCDCAIKGEVSVAIGGESVIIIMSNIVEDAISYSENGLVITTGTIKLDGEDYQK